MVDGFETALRPLRHYADFTGRSTRTELALFYVLIVMLNVAVSWTSLALSFGFAEWTSAAVSLALLCPSLALAVRRLHDTGRTAWWLLLALPSLCLGLWDAYERLRDPFAIPTRLALDLALTLPAGLCGLALAVLLLWSDEEEANRYGPNPRYGEPEAAA